MSLEDKNKALESALGLIERNYGSGSIMRLGDYTTVKIEAISTGSLGFTIPSVRLRSNVGASLSP